MKIALVESDSLLADLVSFRLELLGHEVVVWRCGSEMFDQLAKLEPDLLIVDTLQPDMPGVEAIQRARKSSAAAQLPILALSTDADLSLVEQTFRAGADDYLVTPFDPAVLQEKTDALLLMRQHAAVR